eukprot:COSAG01_NODE_75610_length_194_cov_67.389474_1_plen_42_part_01
MGSVCLFSVCGGGTAAGAGRAGAETQQRLALCRQRERAGGGC